MGKNIKKIKIYKEELRHIGSLELLVLENLKVLKILIEKLLIS